MNIEELRYLQETLKFVNKHTSINDHNRNIETYSNFMMNSENIISGAISERQATSGASNDQKTKQLNIVGVNKWVASEDKLPTHLQTVWLANKEKQWVCLGCLVENDDQFEGEYNYHWAESNGVIYIDEGKIVSECEIDDLDVTHWCALPKPPCC